MVRSGLDGRRKSEIKITGSTVYYQGEFKAPWTARFMDVSSSEMVFQSRVFRDFRAARFWKNSKRKLGETKENSSSEELESQIVRRQGMSGTRLT